MKKEAVQGEETPGEGPDDRKKVEEQQQGQDVKQQAGEQQCGPGDRKQEGKQQHDRKLAVEQHHGIGDVPHRGHHMFSFYSVLLSFLGFGILRAHI